MLQSCSKNIFFIIKDPKKTRGEISVIEDCWDVKEN